MTVGLVEAKPSLRTEALHSAEETALDIFAWRRGGERKGRGGVGRGGEGCEGKGGWKDYNTNFIRITR